MMNEFKDDIYSKYLQNKEKIRQLDIAIECLRKEQSIPFVLKMSIEGMSSLDMPISINTNIRASIENLNAARSALMRIGVITIIMFVVRFLFGGKSGGSAGGGSGGSSGGHAARMGKLREQFAELNERLRSDAPTVKSIFKEITQKSAEQIPQKIQHHIIAVAKLASGNMEIKTIVEAIAYIHSKQSDIDELKLEVVINSHHRYFSSLFFDDKPNGAFHHFGLLVDQFDKHYIDMLSEFRNNVDGYYEGFKYLHGIRRSPEFQQLDLSDSQFTPKLPPVDFVKLFRNPTDGASQTVEWGIMSSNKDTVLKMLQTGNNTPLTEEQMRGLFSGQAIRYGRIQDKLISLYAGLHKIAGTLQKDAGYLEKMDAQIEDIRQFYRDLKQGDHLRIEDKSSDDMHIGHRSNPMDSISAMYHGFSKMNDDMVMLTGIYSRTMTTYEGLAGNMKTMEERMETFSNHVRHIITWGG